MNTSSIRGHVDMVSAINSFERDVPIGAILLGVLAFALAFALIFLCFVATRKKKDLDKARESKKLMDGLCEALIIKDWKPPPAPICRSRPVHQVEHNESTINADEHSYRPPVTALFDDCRSLETFSWSDESVSQEEDDGESKGTGSYAGMDLVRAGVFKQSFDMLKKQPRCKLCSGCYKAGDKVAVLRDPPCSHEFHTGCILSWLARNPNTCPLCASGDATR